MMTSLMMSDDLDIMMLEFAVEKLVIPKKSVFDAVMMKKITVMFRMLDSDWIPVNPNRTDYVPYKGSNAEEMNFHGGKSVVFAIPAGSLGTTMKDVDIQIHVIKEVSKYFEVNPNTEERQNVGVALANVDRLFNGIIKDLREREELNQYLNCFHKRQPISRSLKETYEILDEDERRTGSSIGIYVRLSYFGKSVITEIDRARGLRSRSIFYAQEETNEGLPYQCQELKPSELEAGCWGRYEALPPRSAADRLKCYCDDTEIDAITDRTVAEATMRRNEGREDEVSKNRDGSAAAAAAGSTGGPGTKTRKSIIRTSKSADETQRKRSSKGGTRARKTSVTEGSSGESTNGQKQRRSPGTGDKRASGDLRDRKRTIRKLDKDEKGNENEKPSSEYEKLLEQLRKRRRGGNVTVGIVDKKKNICQETMALCPRTIQREVLTTTRLCVPDLHGINLPCYYPQSYGC